MRNARRISAAAAALALIAGPAIAQTPPGPPKPGPEHKKLEWFVGSWNGKAEMKAGPMGPGGPMAWTENCEWFEGGFSVVCRSEGKGPMGPMKGLSISTYVTEKKVYTFYGADNSGWSGLSEGNTDGKTWSFASQDSFGGKTFHSRFTMTPVGQDRMTFAWEMSEDGKTWQRMMDGESTRKAK